MQVHNLMEDIVKHCLKEIQHSHPDLKDCSNHTLSDIIAIVLNKLPPKYVSTHKGEIFAKTQLKAQVESDVYRELSYAIDKVLNKPRKQDF